MNNKGESFRYKIKHKYFIYRIQQCFLPLQLLSMQTRGIFAYANKTIHF
jgi:hypothetical protein